MEPVKYRYTTLTADQVFRLINRERDPFTAAASQALCDRRKNDYATALGKSPEDYDCWRDGWQRSRASELALLCHRVRSDVPEYYRDIVASIWTLAEVSQRSVEDISVSVVQDMDEKNDWFGAQREIGNAHKEMRALEIDYWNVRVVMAVPESYADGEGVTTMPLRPGKPYEIYTGHLKAKAA